MKNTLRMIGIISAFAIAIFAIAPPLRAQEEAKSTTFRERMLNFDLRQVLSEYAMFSRKVQRQVEVSITQLEPLHYALKVGIGVNLSKDSTGVVYDIIKLETADAGLREGDKIVTVNGKPFTSNEEFQKETHGDGTPGREVTLIVKRVGEDDKETEVTVVVKTMVLQEDRSAETAKLQERLRKEGRPLVEALRVTTLEVIKYLVPLVDSGKSAEDVLYDRSREDMLKAVDEAVNRYDEWWKGVVLQYQQTIAVNK